MLTQEQEKILKDLTEYLKEIGIKPPKNLQTIYKSTHKSMPTTKTKCTLGNCLTTVKKDKEFCERHYTMKLTKYSIELMQTYIQHEEIEATSQEEAHDLINEKITNSQIDMDSANDNGIEIGEIEIIS